IPHAHGSYEALLADDEVDAVYISLPNSLHHEWTMCALASGKHVLCEKPYSRRAAEVEEAFDAAERAGLVLSEAYMGGDKPQTRRAGGGAPRGGGARALGGVHVAAQPADAPAGRAAPAGRGPAGSALDARVRTDGREERAAEGGARRRGADGRRLLLRQCRAAA